VSHLEPIPHQAAFRWELREPGELLIEMPAVRDGPFAEHVDPRAEPTILRSRQRLLDFDDSRA
jgi:hypothetical protein